jgi:D-lyxose ketol-isomerase
MNINLSSLASIAMVATADNGCTVQTTDNIKPECQFENTYFYDKNGAFIEERAKEATIALMKYHGYPIFKDITERLWVTDYGTGQFTKLGLSACVFVNNEQDHYMLADFYLFPNQMLPEHWHLKTDNHPAKMEGWLIRHGQAHVVGIGESNLSDDVVIPQCHNNGTVKTEHGVLCNPGDFTSLKKAGSPHWMYAGPEGAIVNEVATVHDNEGVRHSDKAINDHFLGA